MLEIKTPEKKYNIYADGVLVSSRSSRLEALYDAYWHLCHWFYSYGITNVYRQPNQLVEIKSIKTGEVLKSFTSSNEFETWWKEKYPQATLFVLQDRFNVYL